MKHVLVALLSALAVVPASAADLSPGNWPAAERARLERMELAAFPPAVRQVAGRRELVSATLSPVAVHVGMEALRQGGTAADAAIAVALTQVATDLGAIVSYAGVAELVYYEAKTGKVYALDAGWGSYAGERDAATIPALDVSQVTGGPATAAAGAQGRKTLVPGFMAGIEAAHRRFGRLPWADLFAPSIWYAKSGLTVTPLLGAYFGMDSKLVRTEDGRRFVAQAGGKLPKYGDRFVQPQLAALLETVAAKGSGEMYRGGWAEDYVAAVRREGGAATLEDLKAYRPIWETPVSVAFGDARVVGPGRDNPGGVAVLGALETLGAAPAAGAYWRDPAAFEAMTRAVRAGLLKSFTAGHHSASVVVVDKDRNVAALVHSINTTLWGDTGIVVQGVPISGAAGNYRARLANLPKGAHVPGDMAPVIALRRGKPVAAVATVGSSLHHETVRKMVGALIGASLAETAAAPPLLLNFTSAEPVELVPAGAYDVAFRAELARRGVKVREEPADRVAAIRGTAAFAVIGPDGPKSVEVPKVVVFGDAR